MSRPSAPAATAPSELFLLFALILLAMNLRSPLTAIPPVIDGMRASLGIGPTLAGMLTSIPVLCFGVVTPLASWLIARLGIDAALRLTLIGTALGCLLRPAAGVGSALAGTVLIGAALTVGNIMILMLIARDFPQRRNAVTGLYASAVNVGTMCTSALTAPLAQLLGWRWALAAWALLAVCAYLVWAKVFGLRREAAALAGSGPSVRASAPAGSAGEAKPVRAVSPWRRPVVWWLVLAFAVHLFVYYGVTAWLPSYLAQRGGMSPTRAGMVASALQICGLIGAFGVPLITSRLHVAGSRLLAAMGLTWGLMLGGYLLLPGWWPLWSAVGGFTHGGGFVVIFMLVMRHARDLDENRRISAIVQGLGYVVAASAPILVGLLHDGPGGWTAAYAMLGVIALLLTLVGVALGRDRAQPA